jgi:hypothetical protein
MALEKGYNSYADLDEAKSYFETRLDASAWDVANDFVRIKALVTAATYLEQLNWTGTTASAAQHMAFPREGYFFDPKVGGIVYFDETVVPDRVLLAQFEMAYHLLNNTGVLDDSGSVDSINVGEIKLEGVVAPKAMPNIVYSIVRPLLSNAGRVWWRRN